MLIHVTIDFIIFFIILFSINLSIRTIINKKYVFAKENYLILDSFIIWLSFIIPNIFFSVFDLNFSTIVNFIIISILPIIYTLIKFSFFKKIKLLIFLLVEIIILISTYFISWYILMFIFLNIYTNL